ncbi:hypothetical protein GWI33_010920, partial [Rhynchophorus ferrugineus]
EQYFISIYGVKTFGIHQPFIPFFYTTSLRYEVSSDKASFSIGWLKPNSLARRNFT